MFKKNNEATKEAKERKPLSKKSKVIIGISAGAAATGAAVAVYVIGKKHLNLKKHSGRYSWGDSHMSDVADKALEAQGTCLTNIVENGKDAVITTVSGPEADKLVAEVEAAISEAEKAGAEVIHF